MSHPSLATKPFFCSTAHFIACVSLFLLSQMATAETYKCMEDGVTSFTEQPCKSGMSTPLKLQSDEVTAEARQQALNLSAKEKAELHRLQETRQREELKMEKQMRALAAKNEKEKQQCASLQLKEKWAREDLANASGKNEAKAKSRLKRAKEKTHLLCKDY
jgi:hypothetical protein